MCELCSTGHGRELLGSEQFTNIREVIEQRLGIAEEVRRALMLNDDFPRGELIEFGSAARKITVEGGFLEVEELITLRRGLESVIEVSGFVKRHTDDFPLLTALSSSTATFPDISNHIESMIDRFGKIRDNASPELFEIRRSIRSKEASVSKRLNAVLSKAISDGVVDSDASISIRDGRAVIPVAAVNKRKLAGFIQDQSATGKTYYIEPVEIIEINNELKELEYSERREVVRILTAFTESIRPVQPAIEQSDQYLAQIDVIRAKAMWALESGAVMPIISTEGRLVLRNARHPLLEQTLTKEGKRIVPLNMRLDSRERILVISGPNAGGKSVCLKTVGLLQYMFQCGMPVTALENSEMPLFKDIFIDIGDQQSIDNDLSTYSSHLYNMKRMLAAAASDTLVLIDEFGSGTEPVIGGAIAEAMLESFVDSGTYGVITTHYSNIKYFAGSHTGVVNGAMQFDVQRIEPLFALETGTPGSSFAIEIARKIGLPRAIIESAEQLAGKEHIDLEKQLRDVARDRRYWEQKREKINRTDRIVEELEDEYQDRLAKLKSERQAIIKEARENAEQIVSEANRKVENTIRMIRESQADKETTRMIRRELDSFKQQVSEGVHYATADDERIDREMSRVEHRQQKRLERQGKTTEKVEPKPTPAPEPAPLGVGSKVRIKEQDGIGEITSLKGKRATVAFGQILTTLDTDRLEQVTNAEYRKQVRPTKARTVIDVDISSRKLNFTDRLDVRGMRAVEALEAVQDFVDDAIMVGVSELTILHGKGTGALKEEIRRYLHTVEQVESAGDDHADRGGAGITVVKLKQ